MRKATYTCGYCDVANVLEIEDNKEFPSSIDCCALCPYPVKRDSPENTSQRKLEKLTDA